MNSSPRKTQDMPTRYTVYMHPFTERHYIKSFRKKYKREWDITLVALQKEFEFFDLLFEGNTAETIIEKKGIKICKTKFRIAGTNQSKSGSGNRCITAVHTKEREVQVLLVYNKTDLTGSGNETAQWKKIIKENHPEYTDMV